MNAKVPLFEWRTIQKQVFHHLKAALPKHKFLLTIIKKMKK